MQRLVGEWRITRTDSNAIDFHWELSLQGNRILLTMVYDKDNVFPTWLKGDRYVKGSFRLAGRRIDGTINSDSLTGFVSETFDQMQWTFFSHSYNGATGARVYATETLVRK